MWSPAIAVFFSSWPWIARSPATSTQPLPRSVESARSNASAKLVSGTPGVGVGVGVAIGGGVAVPVLVGVAVLVAVGVLVIVTVRVGVRVGVFVRVGVLVRVAVGVLVDVGVTVAVGVTGPYWTKTVKVLPVFETVVIDTPASTSPNVFPTVSAGSFSVWLVMLPSGVMSRRSELVSQLSAGPMWTSVPFIRFALDAREPSTPIPWRNS